MRVHANRATRHERQRMRAVLSDLRRDRQGEANSGEASVEEEVSLAQLCRRLTLTLTLTLTSPSPNPNQARRGPTSTRSSPTLHGCTCSPYGRA